MLHRVHLVKSAKEFIVAVASLQIQILPLYVTSNQINGAIFCSHWSRVQRNFIVHDNVSLLKGISFDLIDLCVPLIPLERVESLSSIWNKAIFDIVIKSKISFNQFIEVFDDLIRIFI